jgi:putative transcriptional regulator
MKTNSPKDQLEQLLAEKIAGEIVLSPEPHKTLKKWRETFELSQSELARYIEVSPSVISDYESARRKSPGIELIKKFIDSFILLDKKKGGPTLAKYTSMLQSGSGILDIREFSRTMPAEDFVKVLDAELVVQDDIEDKRLQGYTLIDSITAISSLSGTECTRLYGWSTQRALIFTRITYGRSPMIAIRVHPMKPSLVVYHRPESLDKLASKLANAERIPLAVTRIPLEELKSRLSELD